MPKALKLLVVIALVIILLVAGLVGYALFAIDPNAYRPQIEGAAAKQGVALNIRGDLGLSVFPGVAITVADIEASSEEHNLLPSTLASAELSLALLPLLKKQVVIDALTVSGADISLKQSDNTAAVAAAPVAASDVSASQSGLPFGLAVSKLRLENSKVTIHGAEGITTYSDINFTSRDLSASGDVFPISLSLSYPLDEQQLNLSLEGEVGFDDASQQLTVPGLQLTVTDLLAAPVTVAIAGNAHLRKGTATLSSVEGTLAGMTVTGKGNVSDFSGAAKFSANLKITSDTLKDDLAAILGAPLETRDPDAMQTLDVQLDVSGSADRATLNSLALTLDNTAITGKGYMDLGKTRQLALTLSGDSIDVDRYLAPETDQPETASDEQAVEGQTALFAPLAGAIAALDGGKGEIDLTFNSITVANSELTDIEAKLLTNNNRLTLKPLELGVYGGQVATELNIDLARENPPLAFDIAVANIDLARAQQQLTENTQVTGALTMNASGTTSGNTTDALLDNLNASGNLAIENLHLSAINVEQSYCEAARLIERTPAREEPWPKGTDLDSLAGNFAIAGRRIELSNYVTGIGNLNIRGQGDIDLKAEKFDMDVIANLQGERTSADGCAIKSKRIRNRDLPIQCKDSFADAGATSCRPDPDFLKSMLKNELLDKLIDEDGEEKPLKGLLKGLFGQ